MSKGCHYTGPLSRRPGQIACRGPAALVSDYWARVDCVACKASLVGVAIAKGGVTISAASATHVTVVWSLRPGAERVISYADLDRDWWNT